MEAKNGKFSGEITSTSGTIGGFKITDKLSAKGQNYLPPTEADFNKIKNADFKRNLHFGRGGET